MAAAGRSTVASLGLMILDATCPSRLRVFAFHTTRPRPLHCKATQTRSFHSSHAAWSSAKPRISYRIAGSCSAKGRRFHFEKNTYDFDPTVQEALGLIHDGKDHSTKRRKRPDSGEDAFFVSRIGTTDTGAVAFGVADGVGGWAESRVDPADFSHGLCSYMAREALDWSSPAEKLRPKDLLQMGYDRVLRDRSIVAGGSTASIGVAQTDGSVELANLGDSGSVLLRLAAVHHYSTPQTHAFNTPYQLSVIPPRMRAQAAIFGGEYFEDLPRDAAVTNVAMQHGDVLVLATDGLFDNLNNQDILKIVTGRMVLAGAWTGKPQGGIGVSPRLSELTRPGGLDSLSSPPPASSSTVTANSRTGHTLQGLLAASIVGEAKIASEDMRRDGPFAKEAQRYFPSDWYRGGKVDDICVVVVMAVEES
ncbi:hypothetical protein VTN77DRAFT_7777 [Rasamsonia byssochlamydoides]|uniref:uncharacterized protein n=1 Tax=Rasamsonia byssochlamydoides TaxID=89139 RepID=UPI003742BDAE